MEPIEAWISAAKDGKADALGKALESFRGYLLAVARREMEPDLLAKGGASDLVQETFLEAYRDFERFEGGDAEALCVWLRGILMHRLANFRRHFRETEKRRITLEVALPARETSEGREFSDRGPTPSRALEQSERSRMLQDAMGRLLEKHRIVLVLLALLVLEAAGDGIEPRRIDDHVEFVVGVRGLE
ncbi:MAG: hypothetical protein ABS79_06670, partial [Planctomycetes bacterium SCN 63-9]